MLKQIGKFLKKIFTKKTAKAMVSVFTKVGPWVERFYPIVAQIAALTPNKTDDEILKAYEHFGIKDLFDSNVDKDTAIRTLAQTIAHKIVKEDPNNPLRDYLINTAIELAYAKFKEELEREN